MFNPELETMPRDRLRALQDERARDLARYVYDRVPFYRQRMDEASVGPEAIRGVEDLAKLPLTRKDDLRANYPMGLFAVPQRDVIRIHASSGTTGKPTIVGYTRHDIEVFAEVNARSMAAGGARPGMLFHNAYGYGLFTGGLGLHYGGERLGLTVVPVSGGMTERQVMLILDLKPKVIACTPSYAQTLAEAFASRGIPPEEISLEVGILGAEPWTETIRQDVERGLGLQATNIYGLSEIIGPGVANEAVEEKNGSYIWEDHFYPEIVDPETGQVLPEGKDGVLVITTLTKEALPLLRYWTGDITSLTREPGASGRTHARIGMIRGRADDMLVVRGVNVYPTQIEAALVDIAEASPHYQLVVRRVKTLDELELRLELTEAAFQHIGQGVLDDGTLQVDKDVHALRDRIQHNIRENVGITVKVSLLAPGAAPRSAGGKLR
ncbi:MAG: phenylacetate--CoA ligase, partial [Deinococcales bacterium]